MLQTKKIVPIHLHPIEDGVFRYNIININTPITNIVSNEIDLKVNKLAIANDNDELIDLMSQLAQAVVDTDTAAAEEIKTKLEGFKL